MEKKIDAVLSSIKVLTKRVKIIEDKFERYKSRILSIDRRLGQQDEKINNLTYELDTVVKLSDFNEIRDRVKCLEKVADDARREALRQKSYNKRLNLLIHGVDELPDTVWETKLQTHMKVYEVFKEGLKIDLNSIKLVDIQRLQQRPIYDNQHKRIAPQLSLNWRTLLIKTEPCEISAN